MEHLPRGWSIHNGTTARKRHGATHTTTLFLLVACQSKRLESRSVGSDVLQITDVMRPVCHQRTFTQVHFRRAVIRTRRKVGSFLFRLFRFKFREQGSGCLLTWAIVRNGNGCNFRLCFELPCSFRLSRLLSTLFEEGRKAGFSVSLTPIFSVAPACAVPLQAVGPCAVPVSGSSSFHRSR